MCGTVYYLLFVEQTNMQESKALGRQNSHMDYAADANILMYKNKLWLAEERDDDNDERKKKKK